MNRPSRLAIGASYLFSLPSEGLEASFLAALDLGFDGVVPAPLSRPPAWSEAPALLERLPIGVPAIRVESPLAPFLETLASSAAEEHRVILDRVARAAALGQQLECPRLIVEAPLLPGLREDSPRLDEPELAGDEALAAIVARLERDADRDLERACRGLYELCRAFPEFEICLTESARVASYSEPEHLRLLFEEVPRGRLRYWHTASRVRRREELGRGPHGGCLDMLSKYLVGMNLEDSSPSGLQELPGTGNVDYALLAPYGRPQKSPMGACLELQPGLPGASLARATSFLKKFGLQAGGTA